MQGQHSTAGAAASRYHIGVYYFAGWKDDQLGAPAAKPWARFADRPGITPLLGHYSEDAPGILQQQLRWMARSGIAFLAFDQMFQRDGTPLLAAAVNTYLAMRREQRSGVGFAILWSNHSKLPENPGQFHAMVRYWVRTYMRDPDYLLIEGRPQLFVFSRWFLAKNADAAKMSVASLFADAQRIAREEGLPGIDFVAGDPSAPQDFTASKAEGYAAVSAYSYQNGPDSKPSHSYAELDAGWRAAWDAYARQAPPLHAVLPMTAGWDKTPWGGSADPLHDRSRSTPAEFGAHLRAGRAFIDSHYALTRGYGILCCWNEFGEGSYIEPTRGDGGAYLAQVSQVFGTGVVPVDGDPGR